MSTTPSTPSCSQNATDARSRACSLFARLIFRIVSSMPSTPPSTSIRIARAQLIPQACPKRAQLATLVLDMAAPRPFRILGVQQIAIGAPSKAPLQQLWVELLGVPAVGHFRSERENVDEDILAC